MQHHPLSEPDDSPAPGIIPGVPHVQGRPPAWRGPKDRSVEDRARGRDPGRHGAGATHRPPPAASRPKGR